MSDVKRGSVAGIYISNSFDIDILRFLHISAVRRPTHNFLTTAHGSQKLLRLPVPLSDGTGMRSCEVR